MHVLKPHRVTSWLAFVTLWVVALSPALAVDYTWTGWAFTTDWFGMRFDGTTWWTNWFPFGIPSTSSDNALISAAGDPVVLRESVTIHDLTIGDPAAWLGIVDTGTLTAHSATNWGLLELRWGDSGPYGLNLGTGTLTNNGTVIAVETSITAHFVNNGVTHAGLATCHGDFTNLGTVNIVGPSLVMLSGLRLFSATTVANTGLIWVNPYADACETELGFGSSATLSGSGSVVLNGVGDPTHAQLNTDPGILLTNAPDHTLSGCGEINASLANAGLVDANVSGQLLVLKTNAKSNSGTMKATGGGWLAIEGITITQSGPGQILAAGGEVRLADGATIVGGTLNGPSAIFNLSGTNTLTDVANLGPFDILGGTTLAVNGSSLVNHGTITVNPGGVATDTVLRFGRDVALGGTGSVRLSAGGSSAQLAGPRGDLMLVQDSQHTIHGFGQVNANMINHGRVQADVHDEVLEVSAWATFRNYGTLQAVNGSILRFVGGAVTNAGAIVIPKGSTFTADTYMQTAGSITVDGEFEVTGHVADILGGVADFSTDLGSEAAADLTLHANNAMVHFGSSQHLAALSLATGLPTGIAQLAPGGGKVLVTRALAVGAGIAVLDVTDNALILDYVAVEPGPLAGVTGWIRSGYRDGPGGYWDGPDITSSVAAADAGLLTAVGVLDNSDPEVGGKTTFAGETVDATSVLVKYTYWGDANLDGVVDANDYDVIDVNYLFPPAPANTGWWTGDFTYDGAVDANDYDLIDRAYLFQTGPLASGVSAQAATPEPATLLLLALGGPCAASPSPGDTGSVLRRDGIAGL